MDQLRFCLYLILKLIVVIFNRQINIVKSLSATLYIASKTCKILCSIHSGQIVNECSKQWRAKRVEIADGIAVRPD